MEGKVIVFARSLPFHNIGGMEVVCWDLCVALSEKGLSVEVITTNLDEEKKPKNLPKNIKVVFLKNTASGKYSKNWWRYTAEYIENISDSKILAFLSISVAGKSVLKYKSLFPDSKFIMQAHGTSYGEFISKWKTVSLKRWLSSLKNVYNFFDDYISYSRFEKVVAIGDAVEKDFNRFPTNIILSNEKVVKIENGINENMFSPQINNRKEIRHALNINNDALVILSVSRLHEQKGVDNNLYVYNELTKMHDNVYYLVCGEGSYKEVLQEMTSQTKYPEKIIFLGEKNRHDIADLMSAADVFLFLTKRVEGLPLNVLEAMAAGLPIVTSSHLSFFESAKIRKVEHQNYKKAADLVLNLRKEDDGFSHRRSFIPRKNTLSFSVDRYCELITRKNNI